MIRLFLLIPLICLNIFCFAESDPSRKAVFLPQWIPQAQFAGFYTAYEKGFYTDLNIDLTILRGGPEHPSSETLESGKADFATMFLSSAIEKRSQGLPLYNIAQIVQKSALILVAKKESQINSPEDFNGKKVSIWPSFDTQPKALFNKFNLKPQIIPQTFTLNLFLRGGVDVASAMWYNEYHSILNSGINEDELTTFFFDDYGLNFPEDGIYCLKETLLTKRDLCCDFVRASVQGWEYTFDHPEEALDIVMRYVTQANQATNRVHQKWMLERMHNIIKPSGKDIPIGTLLEKEYHTVAGELLQRGIITSEPKYAEFYDNCSR